MFKHIPELSNVHDPNFKVQECVDTNVLRISQFDLNILGEIYRISPVCFITTLISVELWNFSSTLCKKKSVSATHVFFRSIPVIQNNVWNPNCCARYPYRCYITIILWFPDHTVILPPLHRYVKKYYLS